MVNPETRARLFPTPEPHRPDMTSHVSREETNKLSEADLDRRVEARTGRQPFRTAVLVRGHALLTDEPERLGGGNAGPTPFDLLCAALGSCTTITLRMYADRKKWPLEEIVAHVEHRRRAAQDGGAPRDTFYLELQLLGPLDADQRQRLTEIAERCPVKTLLVAGAEIRMAVGEGGAPGD
jgi:uncharacterized OsmC-like protein